MIGDGGENLKTDKMTAKEIVERLRQCYKDNRQFVYVEELRPGTGYKRYGEKKNPEQRIDFWVVNCYPSTNFLATAFEIKVSRSDFLHEIQCPEKRQQALELSNEYYFATPKGLVRPEEIPPECGLVEFSKDGGNASWTVKAPYREKVEPSWRFLTSLARTVKGDFRGEMTEQRMKTLRCQLEEEKRKSKGLEWMIISLEGKGVNP